MGRGRFVAEGSAARYARGPLADVGASRMTGSSFLATPSSVPAELAEVASAPLIGQVFGPYRILSVIQRGGMGEIFLAEIAEGREAGRKVVLKRLLADFLDDERYVSMFQAEARVMSRLDHPNIVRVLDLPLVDGMQCLAMEFVHGRNVLQILKRSRALRQPLDPAFAVWVMRHVLEGLHYAHSAVLEDGRPLDLVHRDVTPGNILVSFDGAVKITDFGIAKSKMSMVATTVGVVKGTTRYLSPEQIRGEEVTRRSDLFSSAAVLVEMLTGTPLFERGSVPPTLFAIVKCQRPPVAELLPFPAPRLAAALERALSTRADQRQATALELADALRLSEAELGPRVDRARAGAYVEGLFPGEGAAGAGKGAKAQPRAVDFTYLFELEGADPEQEAEAARKALEEAVPGARPLDARQFEPPRGQEPAPTPRPAAGPAGMVSLTVPAGTPDLPWSPEPSGDLAPMEPSTQHGPARPRATRARPGLFALRLAAGAALAWLLAARAPSTGAWDSERPPLAPTEATAEPHAEPPSRVSDPPAALEAPVLAPEAVEVVAAAAEAEVAEAEEGEARAGVGAREEQPGQDAAAEQPRRVLIEPVLLGPGVAPGGSPAMGALEIGGPKGARIYVDGMLLEARAPVRRLAVPAGRRVITLRKGDLREDYEVEVAPGGRAAVRRSD